MPGNTCLPFSTHFWTREQVPGYPKLFSGYEEYPGPRGTLCTDHCFESFLSCMHTCITALLFTTRSSTTTRPEDTQKIGPNNLTCPLFFALFLSKLAPTCSSLPLPTSSLASSSSILPHFRPLCSPNLGCQDFREGATGKGLKLEKRED